MPSNKEQEETVLIFRCSQRVFVQNLQFMFLSSCDSSEFLIGSGGQNALYETFF